MQARAPLMIEHRLIEQMIHVADRALQVAEQTRSIDSLFVDLAVDFIKTYADRTHHGKEDKVFFPACRAYLSDEEDRAMLAEFMEFDRKMIHEKYRDIVRSLGHD